MADGDNNQQNNNQQKQKGGGGGGNANGVSLGAKFDASQPGSADGLLSQAIGHGANAVGFIAAMFVAAYAAKWAKELLGVKDAPAPQQGGGGLNSPRQIIGAIHQFKSHPDMAEALPKIEAAVGMVKGGAPAAAQADEKK